MFCFRFVFAPFGRYLGIKGSKPKKPPPNSKLEAVYKSPITKQVFFYECILHYYVNDAGLMIS